MWSLCESVDSNPFAFHAQSFCVIGFHHQPLTSSQQFCAQSQCSTHALLSQLGFDGQTCFSRRWWVGKEICQKREVESGEPAAATCETHHRMVHQLQTFLTLACRLFFLQFQCFVMLLSYLPQVYRSCCATRGSRSVLDEQVQDEGHCLVLAFVSRVISQASNCTCINILWSPSNGLISSF